MHTYVSAEFPMMLSCVHSMLIHCMPGFSSQNSTVTHKLIFVNMCKPCRLCCFGSTHIGHCISVSDVHWNMPRMFNNSISRCTISTTCAWAISVLRPVMLSPMKCAGYVQNGQHVNIGLLFPRVLISTSSYSKGIGSRCTVHPSAKGRWDNSFSVWGRYGWSSFQTMPQVRWHTWQKVWWTWISICFRSGGSVELALARWCAKTQDMPCSVPWDSTGGKKPDSVRLYYLLHVQSNHRGCHCDGNVWPVGLIARWTLLPDLGWTNRSGPICTLSSLVA